MPGKFFDPSKRICKYVFESRGSLPRCFANDLDLCEIQVFFRNFVRKPFFIQHFFIHEQ